MLLCIRETYLALPELIKLFSDLEITLFESKFVFGCCYSILGLNLCSYYVPECSSVHQRCVWS